MGQVKKQYQEWVEQHLPQEVGNDFINAWEVNEAWTKEFEKFIDALLTKKLEENKDE